MARFTHSNAWIEFAGVDLSGTSNNCELTIGVDLTEVTAFSEDWDEFVENSAVWSLSIAGFTDQDASAVEDTLFSAVGAGEQALDYRPQGETDGYKFTGNAFLQDFAVGGAAKGGCPFSATFQGNGALTRTAV